MALLKIDTPDGKVVVETDYINQENYTEALRLGLSVLAHNRKLDYQTHTKHTKTLIEKGAKVS